jgi:chemotaxis protein MotB
MVEPDANSQDQNSFQTETQWHDRILGDAIGYTRSLAAVLESLTEGFRRRGRDLEEQKQRLAILQNERRSVLEERASLEATLRGLTSERDALQAGLDAKDREIRQLRQEVEQGQVALAARSREVQELQTAVAVTTRQVAELREVVRAVERERDSRVHGTQRLAEMERDLLRAREAAERAQEGLARSERVIADLRESLESERQALIAERDALQAALATKEEELGRLRQALEERQGAFEARSREVQELQASLTAAMRQAEELWENVRALQRDGESSSRQIARIPGLERDLIQERDAAQKAQAGHAALREAVNAAEELREEALRDLAAAQEVTAGLRAALHEGQGRTTVLEQEVASQRQECARLDAVVQDFRRTLTEIASLVGAPADTGEGRTQAGQEGAPPPHLVTAVRLLAEQWTHAQEEVASLKSLLQPVREALGTTEALPDRLGEILAERRALERQLQEIVAERSRLQEELAESARREQQAREEVQRLSEQVGALTAKVETPGAVAVPEARTDSATTQPLPPVQVAEAAPLAQPGAKEAGAGDRQAPSAVLSVECKVEGSGEDAFDLLQGQPSRINEVGMVVVFDKRLATGRVVIARFTRGGGEFSVPGSVIRTQPSKGAAGETPSFDHLIRFEHPNLESSRRLKAFLA